MRSANFIESINGELKFEGVLCDTYEEFQNGACSANPVAEFGINGSIDGYSIEMQFLKFPNNKNEFFYSLIEGKYFLDVNSEPPYAKS